MDGNTIRNRRNCCSPQRCPQHEEGEHGLEREGGAYHAQADSLAVRRKYHRDKDDDGNAEKAEQNMIHGYSAPPRANYQVTPCAAPLTASSSRSSAWAGVSAFNNCSRRASLRKPLSTTWSMKPARPSQNP